jgi:hypothetical protein
MACQTNQHGGIVNTSRETLDEGKVTIVRFIRTRLEVSHQERAICVISGPWGIGKTTAVDSFARGKGGGCIVVKIEQGSSRRGASPVSVLQQTLEAVRPYIGRTPRAALSNAYWSLRQMLYNYLNDWRCQHGCNTGPDRYPLLSIVFDEGQYLSREAIEMLRFWNDADRTTTPFPVGLIFIGNSEFALAEDGSGQSVLSGAVRSRALFVETLEYDDVTDDDIVRFITSRGPYEPEAVSLVLSYFRQRRVRRDLRNMMRLDEVFRRRSQGGPVAPDVIRAVLS